MCGSNIASYIPPSGMYGNSPATLHISPPTGDFHQANRKVKSPNRGFHQENPKKVKFPEGGMYDAIFEPHIRNISKKNF